MEGRRPTRLTTSTAAQMATPSVHACSARCAGTAAPRIVDTWASSNACQVEGATAAATNRPSKHMYGPGGPLRPCKQLAFCQVVMLKTGSRLRVAHRGGHHEQDERGVAQVVQQQPEKRPRLDLLEPVGAKGCAPRIQPALALGIGRQPRSQVRVQRRRQALRPAVLLHILRTLVLRRQTASGRRGAQLLGEPVPAVLAGAWASPRQAVHLATASQVHRRLDAAGPEQVHILPHGSTAEGIQ